MPTINAEQIRALCSLADRLPRGMSELACEALADEGIIATLGALPGSKWACSIGGTSPRTKSHRTALRALVIEAAIHSEKALQLVVPAWTPCLSCEDYMCHLHQEHASSCACPSVEEWAFDPYLPGSILRASAFGYGVVAKPLDEVLH
jgi:hypothetical protein